jgi:putative oxidoreductase
VATIVEIVGGLAILVDFKPRWAAGVLALWCLFTGFGFHLPTGDPENTTNFFKT